MLVSAAYEAVRQWKYVPVFSDGTPIRVNIPVAINFELSPHPARLKSVLAPSPTVALTEDEYRRRLAYANGRFASNLPGSQTDRGRIYMSRGSPDEIESHAGGRSGGPIEIWRYRRSQGEQSTPELTVEFVGKEYRLDSSNRTRN
jgi:hypothetical protein